MNRRDLLKYGALAPLGLAAAAKANPKDPSSYEWSTTSSGGWFTADKVLELPLRHGDEIIAMTTFRDEIIVVSKYGEMFRIRSSDLP